MNDLIGHLVVSLSGRDKGCICSVVGISDDEGYVFIADGKVRKVEHPKKKKLKHLKPIDWTPLSEDKLTNRFIREAVNAYTEEQGNEPI